MKLEDMIEKNAVIVCAVPIVACGAKGGQTTPLQGPDGSPAVLQMISCKIVGFESGMVLVEHVVDTGATKYKNTTAIPLANAVINLAEESSPVITPGFLSIVGRG